MNRMSRLHNFIVTGNFGSQDLAYFQTDILLGISPGRKQTPSITEYYIELMVISSYLYRQYHAVSVTNCNGTFERRFLHQQEFLRR